MEKKPSFDLEQNIGRWRATLHQAEGLRPEDVEELELHLRDSVARLQMKGLCLEEAFVIAAHRIGGSRELASEFTKVNQGHVWRSRLLWMLGGYWLFQAIAMILGLGMRLVALWGIHFPAYTVWIGTICSALCLAGILGVCYLSWRVVTRRQRLWNQMGDLCFSHPLWASFCVCLITLGIMVSTGLFNVWQAPHRSVPSADLGRYYQLIMLQNLLLPLEMLAIPVLLIYFFRKHRHECSKQGSHG